MGNADSKTGYGCEMVAMVKLWRQEWSKEPGTTDPLAPFGIVSLASGGSEGGTDIAGMRSSQTGNYGSLPSIGMPNTFLAHAFDIGDPWQVCGFSSMSPLKVIRRLFSILASSTALRPLRYGTRVAMSVTVAASRWIQRRRASLQHVRSMTKTAGCPATLSLRELRVANAFVFPHKFATTSIIPHGMWMLLK